LKKPSYVEFEHDKYPWKPDIDYRKNPHLYKIGRGQQGVLVCEPYKSELHPLWRFKTPFQAQESCEEIYQKFFEYMNKGEFVGADMAKKYLHMGFTRSRRYWNHSSGKKWINDGDMWKVLPYDRTEQRFYESSLIFQKYWKAARENKEYLKMKKQHRSLQCYT
tara:strand:- start:421 stop:909 length:489 start_codon:yes stop_codon:yes gene_type:complete